MTESNFRLLILMVGLVLLVAVNVVASAVGVPFLAASIADAVTAVVALAGLAVVKVVKP